ncbi:MAG: M23 family metallopeptidase [bacterium]|nr:M23 family metallopeptidase [bacterium]
MKSLVHPLITKGVFRLNINRVIALFFLANITLPAQQNTHFCWPIDSPFTITANYGELRPNHFHAGLDFSTNGLVNLPVYAAEEGYLSRIRVSATGYGKCVYITHPGGRVTVYAHLNSFSLKLDREIKKEQYTQQKNEIDFIPIANTVLVRKNEIIGLSGNSGGSTGPHLHFEVREEVRDMPVNPMAYYDVHDQTAPHIEHIAFYDLADTTSPQFISSYKVKKNTLDSFFLDGDKITLDHAIIGFAFSGFDQTALKGNSNGIYSAELYLNGRLIYSHAMDDIPFSEGRYVNEFSETKGKIKFQKCFLPTLYPEHLYKSMFDKGRILLPDTGFQSLQLVLRDESGNRSALNFNVRTRKFNFYRSPSFKGHNLVNCSEPTTVRENGLELFTPANTLYNSVSVILENTLIKNNKIAILPPYVNLNSAATIGFQVPLKFKAWASKLVLKNSSSVTNSLIRNDSVFFMIKNFDSYELLIDSIPPSVKSKQGSLKNMKQGVSNAIAFHVTDKLSGIGKYDLYLNEKWVVAEYDAKSDQIIYYYEDDTPQGLLRFRLEVEDKAGNRTTFNDSKSR